MLWYAGAATGTPFTATHTNSSSAAGTPYYTPAPISPAPAAAATPVDAWYTIINTLKGERAGEQATQGAALSSVPYVSFQASMRNDK